LLLISSVLLFLFFFARGKKKSMRKKKKNIKNINKLFSGFIFQHQIPTIYQQFSIFKRETKNKNAKKIQKRMNE